MFKFIKSAQCHRSLASVISKRSVSKYANNSQIYIHPYEAGLHLASLSKKPEAIPLGVITGTPLAITPNNFKANLEFINVLHQVVADKIHNDFSFIVEAGANANTFMPIYDFRHIPNYARIPEVDNIFGYVQVDDQGKIIPGSYQSNNLYRLCNGESGIIKLSDYLYQELQMECEKLR